MPNPTQADVQYLTLKLLAPVREKFWFGSAIEENCTRIELTEGHGNDINIPTVSDFYVESIPDGVRMDQMQTLVASNHQITTGLVGGQFVLNKAAIRNSRDDLNGLVSGRITGELKKKRAKDILATGPLFTATTICGSGTTLTFGHLLAAQTQLKTHDDRQAPQESKCTIVVQGKALYPVVRNMMGIVSGSAFTAGIETGLSQDLIQGKTRLDRPQPVLSIQGTNVYAENYLPVVSNNSVGVCFFQDGVIYVPAVDLEEVVHDKVIGLYGMVVDLWARYGYGIGPYQQDGVSITSLAAVPTS